MSRSGFGSLSTVQPVDGCFINSPVFCCMTPVGGNQEKDGRHHYEMRRRTGVGRMDHGG